MVPKFRGWHNELEQMIYGKEVCGHIEYTTNLIDALNTMLNEDDYDIEVMQSTGLKDKNGVEIFEGDIVAIKYSESGYHYYEKIVFENGTFTAGDEDWLYNIKDYCVVCGNIYENPELLEPANEN